MHVCYYSYRLIIYYIIMLVTTKRRSRSNSNSSINAPISVHSTGIPIVCSSVQEAEYSGTFAAAKIGTGERQVLEDLGYPQPPTVIHCDNERWGGCRTRPKVCQAKALQVMRYAATLASGPRGPASVHRATHPGRHQRDGFLHHATAGASAHIFGTFHCLS